MYRLLVERRAEPVAPGGPLSRFSQDPVRVVLRPTHAYRFSFLLTGKPSVGGWFPEAGLPPA
jgi:hypothetical protein